MKRYGFTIAEVLVALTIIGVISALTIPTFSANTAKSQYITAFKTTVNQLQNGAKLYKAETNMDFTGSRQNTNGAAIIGEMLTTKLSAKPLANKHTAFAGAVGYKADGKMFALGSVESKLIGSDVKYKTFDCGCKSNFGDPDSTITSGLSDGSVTCTSSTVTDEFKYPCFTGTAPQENFKSATEYPFINLADNNQYGIFVGNTGAINAYADATYVLPSGVTVTVMQTASGCNFDSARWNTSTNKYINGAPSSINKNNPPAGNLCLAYVDVNGTKGPNRVVSCGTNANYVINPNSAQTCNIHRSNVNDVFPVWFYDDNVMPTNAAGYTVLYGEVEED